MALNMNRGTLNGIGTYISRDSAAYYRGTAYTIACTVENEEETVSI